MQDLIYSTLYTAAAFLVAHLMWVAGVIAITMQIIWLYWKIKKEKLEVKKLEALKGDPDDRQ